MKKYRIGINWKMYGEIEILANTFEHALWIAKSDSSIDLPSGDYVDESRKVDEEMSKVLNEKE